VFLLFENYKTRPFFLLAILSALPTQPPQCRNTGTLYTPRPWGRGRGCRGRTPVGSFSTLPFFQLNVQIKSLYAFWFHVEK
jgi:hypothetical protein